jgi:hypothetical protein
MLDQREPVSRRSQTNFLTGSTILELPTRSDQQKSPLGRRPDLSNHSGGLGGFSQAFRIIRQGRGSSGAYKECVGRPWRMSAETKTDSEAPGGCRRGSRPIRKALEDSPKPSESVARARRLPALVSADSESSGHHRQCERFQRLENRQPCDSTEKIAPPRLDRGAGHPDPHRFGLHIVARPSRSGRSDFDQTWKADLTIHIVEAPRAALCRRTQSLVG